MSRPPSASLDLFIDSMAPRITNNPGCKLLILDSIGFFETPEGGASRKQLDRLCQQAREAGYALIMVREKEPAAAAAVSEYVTDAVFELQLKPLNISLSYGPQVRTIEVKKSRVQKSQRGPHEFEIRDGSGIIVFPSTDSVFVIPAMGRKEGDAEAPLLSVFEGPGADLLRKQLARSEPSPPGAGASGDDDPPSGLRAGESLLLYGRPGSLNQDFHFGPGTVTVYTRAAPNTTSFRAEPCTSPPAAGPKARPSAHRR